MMRVYLIGGLISTLIALLASFPHRHEETIKTVLQTLLLAFLAWPVVWFFVIYSIIKGGNKK